MDLLFWLPFNIISLFLSTYLKNLFFQLSIIGIREKQVSNYLRTISGHDIFEQKLLTNKNSKDLGFL